MAAKKTKPAKRDELVAVAKKKNWKIKWFDDLMADARIDPRAFEVGYCMRHRSTAENQFVTITDETISKLTGIPIAGVLRARRMLQSSGWIHKTRAPNCYAFKALVLGSSNGI